MKKVLKVFSMLAATVAFLGASAYTATAEIGKVIEVPGATKAQLFQKVRTWAGRCGNDLTGDENAGVIVTNEEFAYPSPSIDRIQYTFLYKQKNTIQDNRVTVAFDDIMLKAPRIYIPDADSGLPYYGGETGPVTSKSDMAAENKILSSETTNLSDYLHGTAPLTCSIER